MSFIPIAEEPHTHITRQEDIHHTRTWRPLLRSTRRIMSGGPGRPGGERAVSIRRGNIRAY
jgi:hypothetical protein